MTFRSKATLVLCLGLILCGPVARAVDCASLKPVFPKGAITIDARDGTAQVVKSEFTRREQASVVIFNKNPFRYEYKTTIRATEVKETAIAAFFKLAGISAEPAPAEPPEAQAPQGGQREGEGPESVDPCEAYDTNHEKLDRLSGELKKEIGQQVTNHETFTDKLEPLQSTTAETGELCESAKKVIAAAGEFDPNVKALKKKLAELEKAIEDQKKLLDSEKCKDKKKLKAYGERIKYAEREFIPWAETKIKELDTAKDEADELAEAIGETLKDPDEFWEMHRIGPFRAPTDVNVILERKDLSVKEGAFKQIADVPLNFGGGQRFFLAGGIAGSSTDRTRYKVIDGVVGDEVKKVIGLEEDSSNRVSAAVLLHGLIYRPAWGPLDGIGLALGVGAAGTDESTIEFFAGPTFSFANDHLFFTIGAFRGSEDRLGGGFVVGQEVDEALTLPLVKHPTWSPGFGLTFRIP